MMRTGARLVHSYRREIGGGWEEVKVYQYQSFDFIGVEFLDPSDVIPPMDKIYWYYDPSWTSGSILVGDIVSVPTYVVPSGARAIVRQVSQMQNHNRALEKDIRMVLRKNND